MTEFLYPLAEAVIKLTETKYNFGNPPFGDHRWQPAAHPHICLDGWLCDYTYRAGKNGLLLRVVFGSDNIRIYDANIAVYKDDHELVIEYARPDLLEAVTDGIVLMFGIMAANR